MAKEYTKDGVDPTGKTNGGSKRRVSYVCIRKSPFSREVVAGRKIHLRNDNRKVEFAWIE